MTARYRLPGASVATNTLIMRRDGFDAWGDPQWRFTLTVGDEVIFDGTVTGPPWASDDDHAALVTLTHLIQRPHPDHTGRRWQTIHAAHLALALDDDGHPLPTLARYRIRSGDPPAPPP